VSVTLSNEYIGLAQGPIEHEASSIVNAVCGDASLKIGDAVRLLPVGSGVGFTQTDDVLPRVGLADSFGSEAYGIVVGGDFEGIYRDGIVNLDSNNLALGLVVSFFGDGVRVCVQGRCLALVDGIFTGSINVGDPLTSTSFGLVNAIDGSQVITRALQPASKANSIIAVDVKREGKIAGVGGFLFTNSNFDATVHRTDLNGNDDLILFDPQEAFRIDVNSKFVFFIDPLFNKIIRSELNGSSLTPFKIIEVGEFTSLAVDNTSVYAGTDTPSIVKIDLDGNNLEILPTVLVNPVFDIAVDSNFIYLVDFVSETLLRTDLNGNGLTTLITGLDSPFGVTVDSTSIYIAQGLEPVEKFDLDGSNRQTLPITAGFFATGVAVDSTSLYLTDAGFNEVSKTNLDGENFQALPIIIDEPFDIAVLTIGNLLKKELTVLASDVTGASPLMDFPLLVSITDTDLATHARPDGFDIFFTKADGITRVPYDRESYDSATGTLVAWVLVDLSDTVDNKFFMFYGDASAADQQNPLPVWNTRFNDVYHMNETVFPYNNSSIGQNFSGTGDTTPTTAPGEIDTSVSVDGFDKIMATDDIPDILNSDYFITLWAKLDGVGTDTNATLRFIQSHSFFQDNTVSSFLSKFPIVRTAISKGSSIIIGRA